MLWGKHEFSKLFFKGKYPNPLPIQEVNSIAFWCSKIFFKIFFTKILAWCNSIETSKILLKILRWNLLKGYVQTVPYVVLENLFQKDFSKRFLKVQLNCTRLKIFLRKILNKSFKKILKKAIELASWSLDTTHITSQHITLTVMSPQVRRARALLLVYSLEVLQFQNFVDPN